MGTLEESIGGCNALSILDTAAVTVTVTKLSVA